MNQGMIGEHEAEVPFMGRIFLALICACAMVLGGCGSPAQAAGEDQAEDQASVEVKQPEVEQPDVGDEGEADELDREELASAGLQNVEMMGFEIYEPIGALMYRNESGVSWTDDHGCVLTVVAQDAPEDADLSTDTERLIFCGGAVKALEKVAGYIIGDPYGDGTAHYDFAYFDDDGEIKDGEIKVISDGARVYYGEIRYEDGHEERTELFDLDSFRIAGEPVS